MALYLEQKERDLIKKLIGEPKDFDFLKISLLKKIKTDEGRLEEIENCEHVLEYYRGERHSCSKCGQLISEIWSIINK